MRNVTILTWGTFQSILEHFRWGTHAPLSNRSCTISTVSAPPMPSKTLIICLAEETLPIAPSTIATVQGSIGLPSLTRFSLISLARTPHNHSHVLHCTPTARLDLIHQRNNLHAIQVTFAVEAINLAFGREQLQTRMLL